MNISEYLSTVETIHEEASRRGVSLRICEDEGLRGRSIRLDGRELCSFSSCSYLGLEFHPALVQGVVDAVQRFGTQFSSSRGYLSAPSYRELEPLLSEVFGGYALVSSSTSLGHQMVLPVIATEKDAIVVDNQAHRSLQIAATLAQAQGTTVEIVRHRELDEKALEAVERLARRHRTVYFACDGVYSMYGDCAPLRLLQQILDVAPNVRLYVDDAHGMSWAGTHGRGFFLSRMALDERIVLGTSLNKAFAASGGCFVFPTERERERVRMTGGPYVFSGPLQPPMLGAAVASAKVHLSNEIQTLQEIFRERVTLCNRLLREHDLPLLSVNEGPICFIRLGKVEAAMTVAERLIEEGYFINISHYPAVPTKRAGLRLTLTALHSPEDVRGVVDALARHVPCALAEHGVSREELDELYRDAIPREAQGGISLAAYAADAPADLARGGGTQLPAGFKLETFPSITGINPALWDSLMGTRGASSWEALRMAEQVFSGQPRREHDWSFYYIIVRDDAGRAVAATYATRALIKDDMFMQEEVSRAAERERETDKYFLTSEVLSLGSLFSEGNHLYLERRGPWRQVLAAVVDELLRIAREQRVSSVVIRDLPGDDPAIDGWMREHDFLKVPTLDSHHLRIAERSESDFVADASWRTRKFLKQLIAEASFYRPAIHGVQGCDLSDEATVAHLYRLYLNVASRKLRINVFPMPEALLPRLLGNPSWEVVALMLDRAAGGPDGGLPVAWYAAHRNGGGSYAPFMCGIDYEFVHGREFGAYRQLLLQVTRRAREVGATTIHWGMDADQEKGRYGTHRQSTCAYVFGCVHDQDERLQMLVSAAGLRPLSVG